MSQKEIDHQHMEAKREVGELKMEQAAINRKLNTLLPNAESALKSIQFTNDAQDRLAKWSKVEGVGQLIEEGADVQRRLEKALELLAAFGLR